MNGGDSLRSALRAAHASVDDFHAGFTGDEFEDVDELPVLDVKSVPALDGRSAAVGLPGKDAFVPHESRWHIGATKVFVAIEAIRTLEIRPVRIKLLRKRVVESVARSPKKTNADLPSGLRE